MELMGDGLIAFLAAVGVSTILWLLAETLLRRHRPVAEAILAVSYTHLTLPTKA